MSINDLVENDIDTIRSAPWNTRRGTVVPNTENIALNGGAVELDAAYLFADMANSSKMARTFDRRITAKILKSFLAASVRIIRYHNGTVMSFDGDRVMAAFVGATPATTATRCAFSISWMVNEVLRPKFESKYETVRNAPFRIRHATGVEYGTVFIVRAGARGDNDLISIGGVPNLAAKFSDIREDGYDTYISRNVYNRLSDSAKKTLTGREINWEARSWSFAGSTIKLNRTSYWRKPKPTEHR